MGVLAPLPVNADPLGWAANGSSGSERVEMRRIARQLHAVIAWVFVVALVVQVWLAGRGVFESPTVFATHRDVGYTLSLFPVVLLVLGLLGGMGRRVAILAVVIFGLFILQSVFVVMRDSSPAVAALHPVNGFLIVLLAVVLARDSWMMRTAAA
jgi:hypothetical protein